jgi:hypothetical protein
MFYSKEDFEKADSSSVRSAVNHLMLMVLALDVQEIRIDSDGQIMLLYRPSDPNASQTPAWNPIIARLKIMANLELNKPGNGTINLQVGTQEAPDTIFCDLTTTPSANNPELENVRLLIAR